MKKTIGIVFDFDDTLAPDSTSSFIKSLGKDVGEFWDNNNERMYDEGWDPIPVYLYHLILLSNSGNPDFIITRDKLAAHGKSIEFFKGVNTLFKRLRDYSSTLENDVEIEFYMISSGIGEILRNTKIASQFTDIFTSDYAYDDEGRILFPKNIISSNEKTRFLYQISKGIIGEEARQQPFKVHEPIKDGHYRIPLSHIIYVGDGYTDIPCFSLLNHYGGVRFVVYNPERVSSKWGLAWDFMNDKRITNVSSATYTNNSDIFNNLKFAINSIAIREND